MCRLLGWAASTPRTLADLLGEEDLAEFTSLSRKHADGWGVAWSSGRDTDAGDPPVRELAVRKDTDAAHYSRKFADWTHHEPADLGMVHLRWATLGLEVTDANTHPFLSDGMAFAHNGSVRPPSALDALLTPAMQAAMVGNTDSERYFRAVLSRMADSGTAPVDIGEALAGTADRIAATTDFTSLNCLLMTPDTLYAMSRFDPAHEEEPEYFNLRYRITDDAVVVASTGWGRGWQPLANGDLLTVQRQTLEVSVVSTADLLLAS
jgi:predicted glutamine amidotransferase